MDKNLTIDAYRGEADTTIRDLIDSYTHIFANACLSAVADFINHTATGEIASDSGEVEWKICANFLFVYLALISPHQTFIEQSTQSKVRSMLGRELAKPLSRS
jgi:hypothetical protein